jgi:glutamate/tyrosine decarboxylase-like PLP-dependent enzyme
VRTLISDDAHPAVDSALRYLGLGRPTARIATDGEGRMRPAALAEALRRGEGPAIVVAQAGQINTGAFDPGVAIAEICREAGAWLHVDGAFGLWARAVPELDPLTAGLDRADSWAVDGHKWLQLPYDSGFAIVADQEAHRAAMSMVASYLPPAAADEHDPGQLVPELSRRARGFTAWAMLRTLGRQGVVELVRRHCRLARRLAGGLAEIPGAELRNEVVLNQVLVAFGDGEPEVRDVLTRAVIARLQERNICFAGGARWRGRWVLRLSLISQPLQDGDIDRLVAAIAEAWRDVQIAHAPGRSAHPRVVRA